VFAEYRFSLLGRVFAGFRRIAMGGAAHRLNAHLPNVRGVHRQLRLDQVMQHPRKVPATGARNDFADMETGVSS
jgi:hypothetical protein